MHVQKTKTVCPPYADFRSVEHMVLAEIAGGKQGMDKEEIKFKLRDA